MGGSPPRRREPRRRKVVRDSGTWRVRAARPSDASGIFRLLRELARYERLLHTLTGTPAALARHLRGSTPPRIHGLVAEQSGKMIGYAIYFMGFSSFRAAPLVWLEDLYVSPRHRRRGIGDHMLRQLARITLEVKADRLEWWVLAWNEPALAFYRAIGATGDGEERVWRLRGGALQRFARGGTVSRSGRG